MAEMYDPHADDDDDEEGDFLDDFSGAADDLLDRVEILREKAKTRGTFDDPDLAVSQALRLLLADAMGDVVSMLEAHAEAQAATAELLQAAHEAAHEDTGPGKKHFRLVDDD